ncbi:hypothetical protein [Halorubellus litoreus]|uniref:Tat (Twin-arginine translocation) pathway signal sequence n=1 Tax=Halorubellus litoreus TaxID=755308 RepID=A0ABD5VCB3_9EURY
MEETTRRDVLRSTAALGAAMATTATAGCASIGGIGSGSGGDGGGGEYRSTVAHPGWFDVDASAAAPDGYRLKTVRTWNHAAFRDLEGDLPEWIRDAAGLRIPGLDVPIHRQTFTLMPGSVRVSTFADADELADAASESDAYAPVDGVEGFYGHADENGVTVVGDGVAANVDRYGGDESSPVEDVAAHAEMLAASEEAALETSTTALSRADRLVDALGEQTIARLWPRRTNLEIGLKAVGEGFTVGADRTEHRAVGLGDDLDPDTFKERRFAYRDYEPYDDVAVSAGDGRVVLEASVPTSEFDLFSRY